MSPARKDSKACDRCAMAKTRCVQEDGRKSCMRCLRLKKECTIETKRHRNREKRLKSSKLTRIEQKVDRLITSLENQQTFSQSTTSPISAHQKTATYIFENGRIEQADKIVACYKSTKMLQFPFVIIPCSTDASLLIRTAPFLFLCIIAVSMEDCYPSDDSAIIGMKQTVGHAINQIVIEAIGRQNTWNGDADFAFLQGLIIYLAWSHYQLPLASKQIYLILQLAMNCAADLGIDDFPTLPDRVDNMPNQLAHDSFSDHRNSLLLYKAAEYRAFLGCYHLCSSMSMLRGRLPSSSEEWIRHCCCYLECWDQYPTDKSLNSLVKIRLLNARIYEAFPSSPDLNSMMLVDNFRQELCRIESSSALHVSDANYSIQLEAQFSTVLLNLIVLLQNIFTPLHGDETRRFGDTSLAVQDLMSYFFHLPSEILHHLPMSTTILPWLSFALMSLIAFLPLPPECESMAVLARAQLEDTIRNITINPEYRNKRACDMEGRNLVEKYLWFFDCLVLWNKSQMSEVNSGLQLFDPMSCGGNVLRRTVASALSFLNGQLKCPHEGKSNNP